MRKERLSDRIIRWIESHCRVPEGKLRGQWVKLHGYQRKIVRGIYDSRTRTAIISMGRKNAKTTFSACLLLVHLVGPMAEPNSQLYSSAMARKQAAVIFNLAAKMVRMNPDLAAYVTIRDSAKELICAELGTIFTALSAEAPTAHGLSPILVIHDELGQVRGPVSELYDALETAQGAHESPLSIIISTQAPTDADLLSILIDDAKRGEDPRTKLFLWEVPEPENDKPVDLMSETNWKLSNPGYGTLLNPEVVQDQAEKARRMPSRQAAFKNLVLNMRVSSKSPLIPQAVWKANGGVPDPDILRAGPGFAGLDLSSLHDLTAFVWVVAELLDVWETDPDDPDAKPRRARRYHVGAEFWAPEKNLLDRVQRDRVRYDVWAEQGFLKLTPGASVDYEWVATRISEICQEHDIAAIAFDRWRMQFLEKELVDIGAKLPLVPWGQGYKDMSPAIDATESALSNGRVLHGGHPILTWNAANAHAVCDPAGNRKLDKIRSTGRIDGMQSLTMAIGAEFSGPKKTTSRYNQEGARLMEV